MALPQDINMASHRANFPSPNTTTHKTRLDPFKHRQLFSHPFSTSSSPPSTSVPYPPRPNMFTTPTKATSRFPPAPSPWRIRQSPIMTSPYTGPGGLRAMSPPTLSSIVNASPSRTPLRRHYTPTRFQSPPKTPKSHRGRAPAQSIPRKERSFQSLEKPTPAAKPLTSDPTFSDWSDKAHAASAKSKIPAGAEGDIFFAQLGKLNDIRSITKELMNTRISAPKASPVPDFEATRKARRERQRTAARATKTPELDSPGKREALFESQRKKLREEALRREEQQREPESPVAGSSQERTRLSPDSANKLKRKQQDQMADDAAASGQAQQAAQQMNDEELAAAAARRKREAHNREIDRLQAEEEAANRRREEEFVARRRQEEREHQERLARAQAQRALEEEEARRLAAENEIRRRVAEEVQKRAIEEEALRKTIEEQARRKAAEEFQRIAREEELTRKAEDHARWRAQEQREQQERLDRLAREQAQEDARIRSEHARIQAEHARRIAEQLAEQARLEAERTRLLAEEHARILAEQEARLFAEQEAQRLTAQALAAEEARVRAMAESFAQAQAHFNARAQAAFGEGASWHNAHEFYNRFQEQQQQQQHHQQHQHQQHQRQQQHQQQHPSPEFEQAHQQPFSEQQQHKYQQEHHYQYQHNTDIPMREPSLADINMDGPGTSTPRPPSPEPAPPPPPPPPPPPAPLTKAERIQAYWSRWAIPVEQWPLTIGFEQIPWPVLHDVNSPEDITVERLYEFYTHADTRGKKSYKKLAQTELMKWHSDKLNQKFKGRFDGSESMISTTANEITRFLIQVLVPMK